MPRYVRVKSPTTKHEFDVPETDPRLKRGLLTRIKDDRYPPVDRPRRAKHFIPRKQAAVAVEIPKEPTDG
ncbi:hypothetical protein [Jiangella asiatica]|uniref:Uncharacterized protein n=1 Tax=Jiangella asiatica TaxID=2530372 RepID=A0A4R5CY09_9ACTN|nr:hypothetical protein [Jiangella asiatica]TDE02835.1 hypothetical protein E1269_21325 [Jiangella asiatica]